MLHFDVAFPSNPEVYQGIISGAPRLQTGGNTKNIDISRVVISSIVRPLVSEAFMDLAEPSPTGRDIVAAAFCSITSTSVLLPVLFHPTQTGYLIPLTPPGVIGVTSVDTITDSIEWIASGSSPEAPRFNDASCRHTQKLRRLRSGQSLHGRVSGRPSRNTEDHHGKSFIAAFASRSVSNPHGGRNVHVPGWASPSPRRTTRTRWVYLVLRPARRVCGTTRPRLRGE